MKSLTVGQAFRRYHLEGEIELDAPVPPMLKRLGVLIAPFYGEIESFNRDLYQRPRLHGVKIAIPHTGKVPAEIDRAAGTVGLMD